MNEKHTLMQSYYPIGNLKLLEESAIIWYMYIYTVFMESRKMSCRYHHPLVEGFAEQVHTPGGVRSLVENSHLMDLLRELEGDGYDVSGATAELIALVNYVTSTQMSMKDLQTHLDYCTLQLRQQLK